MPNFGFDVRLPIMFSVDLNKLWAAGDFILTALSDCHFPILMAVQVLKY